VARSPGRHYGLTNGGIEQIVDATPYRGKWVRLTAMCREEALADSHASLWLSLTPKVVLDMQIRLSGERTITETTWRPYEIILQVPEITVTISYGLSLEGDGRAWIDDVSLEVVPKPPE
jgi:erythromycin esterase